MGMVTTSRLHGIARKRSGMAVILCLSALLALRSSEAQSQPDRSQAAPVAPTVANGASTGLVDSGDLPINVGDVISIQVFATPELSGSLRVDQTGAVTLPLGGKIQVSGITAADAATLIEERLKTAEIMLDPHVTVIVTQFATQGITVTGEVRNPGFFPLVGPHSVADALAIAGEPTISAGDTITLVHRSDPAHPVVLSLNALNFETLARDTPIYPRDILTISKASVIYLLGDINRVGPLPVVRGEPPTVLNVLAQAGGAMTTASLSKTLIIRKTPSGTTTIPINLAEIMKNRAPNILLQSADVLIVPHNFIKSLLLPLPQQVVSGAVGLATAAIYVR